MTEADVVISWFATPSLYAATFQRPTRFIQLPSPSGQKYAAQIAGFGNTPILDIVKKYAPGIRPLRVACVGFSEGCQGVREMLRSPDGGRIDSALAIDGIHAKYQPGSTTTIVPGYVTPWGAMAQRATQGRTLLAITTSSIRPPGFVSTTETADWIWRYATGGDRDIVTSPISDAFVTPFTPPIQYPAWTAKDGSHGGPTTYVYPPVSRYRRKRGFVIVNYKDLDPTGHNDHLFQGQRVLADMVGYYLADRWNAIGPKDGMCVLAAPELDAPIPAGCFPPSALSDLYVGGNADPKPLDIPTDSEVDPTLPGEGPPAPPPETVPAPKPSGLVTFARWTGAILGAALVLEGGRRVGGAIEAAYRGR